MKTTGLIRTFNANQRLTHTAKPGNATQIGSIEHFTQPEHSHRITFQSGEMHEEVEQKHDMEAAQTLLASKAKQSGKGRTKGSVCQPLRQRNLFHSVVFGRFNKSFDFRD